MMAEQNAFRDGEAEAGAVGAAGEKGIKDFFTQRFGHAATCIRNVDMGETGGAVLLDLAANRNLAAVRHRLGGVDEEVEQDLLDLAFVYVDNEFLRGVLEVQVDLALGKFQADQHDGVVDDIGYLPARMQAGGRLGKREYARDDGFELVDFFADDADVGFARIFCGKIESEVAVKKFDDGERIADLVRDFGGEQAECGELFVFAEQLFALENAGVEAGILQRDCSEAGEGGNEPTFVVVEAVDVVGEDDEYAEDVILVHHRCSEHGAQRGVTGKVDQILELRALGVGEFELFARVDDGGDEAGVDRQVAAHDFQFGVGERGGSDDFTWFVVKIKCAGPTLHDLPRVVRERIEEVLGFDLGHEGLADRDQVFKLAGFAAQLAQLPEPGHHGRGFLGAEYE